jgi:triosephosphate isomerase
VLGAQNVNQNNEGAFTGEISTRMLIDVGVKFVIIGHSERRQHYNESGAEIRKKIEQVALAGLTPMLCIGETESERFLGQTSAVLKKQIEEALFGLSRELLKNLVIAYEPIWAIGTGKIATADIADETHHNIRKILADLLSLDFAHAIRILYGGSVKPEFMSDLMAKRDIDGVLVGGASLDPQSFQKIINY